MRLSRTDFVPLLAIIALAIVAVPVSGQDVTGTWVLSVDLGALQGAVTRRSSSSRRVPPSRGPTAEPWVTTSS